MEEYEKIMANGVAGAAAQNEAAKQAEPVPTEPTYVCQKCHGKGVIIDNMLSGSTKPCPDCQMLGTTCDDDFDWEGDVDGNVSIDSMMPMPEPGGIISHPMPIPWELRPPLPTPTEAVKRHLSSGGAKDTATIKKVWAEAQKAIADATGVQQDYLGDPSAPMTATEVLAKQRETEFNARAEKIREHAKAYGMTDQKIGKLMRMDNPTPEQIRAWINRFYNSIILKG